MTDIFIRIDDGIDVVAKGHAGFNPDGPDIVCAAVSTLCGTWLECVAGFAAEEYVTDVILEAENGDYRVYCKPCEECEGFVLAAVSTILTGIALIEASYPEYVRVRTFNGAGEKS